MVKHKPVKSLRHFCLSAIPKFVKDHVVRCAHLTHCSWYRVMSGDIDTTEDEMLTTEVAKFGEYILANMIWTMREEVFGLILKGIDDGFIQVRKGWRPGKDHTQYGKILEAMLGFIEAIAWPRLRSLDFSLVPRTLRRRMLTMIPKLKGIRTLMMCPGKSGGYIPLKGEAAIEFSINLAHLNQLCHFSLKKDCTVEILTSVVDNSKKTLQILDVENSKGISDNCVPVLSECAALLQLNICSTNLSEEGRARMLMALPQLRHLIRADYLADILGWIDYLDEVENPVYEIREFLPSQSYFFHETWQLDLVVEMCPKLEKMLFIYHPDICPSLLPIAGLKHLTDLQIHGGGWTDSNLDQLLKKVGPGLNHLGLISVKTLTREILTQLFEYCNKLESIVFNNCEFSSRIDRVYTDLKETSIKELVITCNIRKEYLQWIFSISPKLTVLHLGYSTSIDDSVFIDALHSGSLRKLQELQVERSNDLSMATVECLLEFCQDLKSLGDLREWSGISGQELGELRLLAHLQNLDIDLSSHQILRRFMNLTGEERETMINLLTGPVLERIRLAEQERRNQVAAQQDQQQDQE